MIRFVYNCALVMYRRGWRVHRGAVAIALTAGGGRCAELRGGASARPECYCRRSELTRHFFSPILVKQVSYTTCIVRIPPSFEHRERSFEDFFHHFFVGMCRSSGTCKFSGALWSYSINRNTLEFDFKGANGD